MHEEEIADLYVTDPDLFARAIAMEDHARAGKHQIGKGSVKGLGRRWTWRGLAERIGLIRRAS